MSDNISSRIDLYYDSLSKGHKKIADYIRTNYEKSSFMTAAELGRAVGISESTVVRFAVNIGFSGYPELQKNLQEMVKSRLTSVQRMEAAKRNDGRDPEPSGRQNRGLGDPAAGMDMDQITVA